MIRPNQTLLTFYIFYHTYLVLTRRFVEKLRLMSLKKSHPSLYFFDMFTKIPKLQNSHPNFHIKDIFSPL